MLSNMAISATTRVLVAISWLFLATVSAQISPKTSGSDLSVVSATAQPPEVTIPPFANRAGSSQQRFGSTVFLADNAICGTWVVDSTTLSERCVVNSTSHTCAVYMSTMGTRGALGCWVSGITTAFGLVTDCVDYDAYSKHGKCTGTCEEDFRIAKCTHFESSICRYVDITISGAYATSWYCDTSTDVVTHITTIKANGTARDWGINHFNDDSLYPWQKGGGPPERSEISASSSSISSTATSATPTNSASASTTDEGKSGPSTGTIAGAAVGGVAGLAILLALAFFYGRRTRRAPPPPDQPTMGYRDPNPLYPDTIPPMVGGQAELAGGDGSPHWGHQGHSSWGSSEMAGSMPIIYVGSSPSPGMASDKFRPGSETTDVSRLSAWHAAPPGELYANDMGAQDGPRELSGTSPVFVEEQALPTVQEGDGRTEVERTSEQVHTRT